ncbi:MAG TPA: gliding motility-associated C-terminal domain-containing protein [Bacteroidales bacterium]|mgnify:FL=1|nr:gliding motility-associated C-terminal domain-containing protein [Bacteroidales bacterium]HOS57593.1 gliding motility-associated C-terminal domain-containing protein [Bacteroidales bacterium]
MMKEKEIGKLFREKFKNFNSAPSDDLWKKIENDKGLRSFNRKKRFLNPTSYTIAIITAVAIVTTVLLINIFDDKTTKVEEFSTIEKKEQAIPEAVVNVALTEEVETSSAPVSKPLQTAPTINQNISQPAPLKPEISEDKLLPIPQTNHQKLELLPTPAVSVTPPDMEEKVVATEPPITDKTPAEPEEVVRLEYSNDTTLCKNSKLVLFVKNSPKVYWHIGANSPTLEFYPTENEIFYVDAVKPDGKDTTLAIRVNVFDCSLYIPNAFTPNGDGLNDEFRVESPIDIYNFEMSIFELSGRLLFHTKYITQGWDGTYEGKKSPTGAYLYIITYKDRFGEKHLEKGQIVLYR